MMSIEYIQALAEDAGLRARHQRWEPKELGMSSSVEDIRSIPNLGNYVPEGWEEIEDERMFVDSSGFGVEGEPALTVNQFMSKIWNSRETRGYGIVQEGQFQIYVGVFRRV